MKNDLKIFFGFLIAFGAIFFAMYYPIITCKIFTADDFNYFFHWNITKGQYPGYFVLDTHHWLTDVNLLIGRPLSNMLNCFVLRVVGKDLSGYALMRSFAVSLAAIIAALFAFKLYRRFGLDKPVSFLTSFLIFTLPGMMIYITYLTFSVAWLTALLLTFVSAELTGTGKFRNSVFSFAALIISLLIYPPAAMFYIVCIVPYLLFRKREDWPETKLLIMRNISIFIAAILTYFIAYRFLFLPAITASHAESAHILGSTEMAHYTFSLGGNILGKIFRLGTINAVAFSLWHMFCSRIVMSAALLTIIGGGIVGIARTAGSALKQGVPQSEILRFYIESGIAAIMLLVLVNAPFFSEGCPLSTRAVFSYMSLIVIFLVAAILMIGSLIKTAARNIIVLFVLSALAVTSASLTCDRVFRWITANHLLENRFIQYKLGEFIRQGRIKEHGVVNQLHVVRVPWGVSFLGLPFGVVDEIYSASARSDKIAGLIGFNLIQMGFDFDKVNILYEGIGSDRVDPDALNMNITNSGHDEKVNFSGKMIIDMNELMPYAPNIADARKTKSSQGDPLYTDYTIGGGLYAVSASSEGLGHFTSRAFDVSAGPDDFWEAGYGGYPQWIKIVYPDEKRIKGYEFISGYAESERMPKNWRFEGSHDGVSWEVLDERNGETGWKIYDSREYAVKEPNLYKFYRFYFTGGNDPLVRIYEIRLKD